MKTLLLSLVCFCFSVSYGQLTGVGYGIPQVFNSVTIIGREIKQADQVHKAAKQQQEIEDKYFAKISYADNLMTQQKYEEAITAYNEAIEIKQQEQYPRDQIAKATEEINRLRDQQYQQVIYRADSLYNEMLFQDAIDEYQKALVVKNAQYAQDQLGKAHQNLYRLTKVQFSGLVIADTYNDSLCSKAATGDIYSDFISPGQYNYTEGALLYSPYQTLDGIVVPANTRLIVYSEPNFKGKVLLDVAGPAVINNVAKQKDPKVKALQTKNYTPATLQKMYPPTVRVWSQTDMSTWTKGSFEIVIVPSF